MLVNVKLYDYRLKGNPFANAIPVIEKSSIEIIGSAEINLNCISSIEKLDSEIYIINMLNSNKRYAIDYEDLIRIKYKGSDLWHQKNITI